MVSTDLKIKEIKDDCSYRFFFYTHSHDSLRHPKATLYMYNLRSAMLPAT